MEKDFFYVKRDKNNGEFSFINLRQITRVICEPEKGFVKVFLSGGDQAVLVEGEQAKGLFKLLQTRAAG